MLTLAQACVIHRIEHVHASVDMAPSEIGFRKSDAAERGNPAALLKKYRGGTKR